MTNKGSKDYTSLIPQPNLGICAKDTYDCKDFTSKQHAQETFDYCMQIIGMDIHKIDGDNNGLACESK